MMSSPRIEQSLAAALTHAASPGCPPRLASAIDYAVFPGGARIRPRLCLAIAQANAEDDPQITDAAACAIELLHCASLVHDDLPCFDDAPTRRGKASVHRTYGERLAVLTGDALIVTAFQCLTTGTAHRPERLIALLEIIGTSVGSGAGIVGGQAWECELEVSTSRYQRAKTGALFAAATMAGAVAAGTTQALAWRALGEGLGEAFQIADDILDIAGNPAALGKPVGRDAPLERPNAVLERGMNGALRHLEDLVAAAIQSIPECPHAATLRDVIQTEARGLLPEDLRRVA